MINICANNQSTKFINWVPSENGPLINGFGSYNNGNCIYDNIVKIYNSLKNAKPIFNISIDHSFVDIFEIDCPISIDSITYIEWFLMNLYGKKYDSFDHFQFKGKDSFLNISLDKEIKSQIYNLDINTNLEIRCLSIDIFSAECGARSWFKADGNYVIWKIGNRGSGHILIIKNNILSSFFKVKLKKNNYVNSTNIFNDGSSESFIKFVNHIMINKEEKAEVNNNYGQIFFYNGGCGKSAFNSFIGIGNEHFTALNPFDVLDCTMKKPSDLYEQTSYAEVGIGFSGLDV